MRSDVLNCQHMLSELAANSYCLKAALWTLYGQSNMASLCSQHLLHLDSTHVPVCLAMCNVSRTLAAQVFYLTVLVEVQLISLVKWSKTISNYFRENMTLVLLS